MTVQFPQHPAPRLRVWKETSRKQKEAPKVERLCKIGVLSKVEMEQRLLKVIQCEAELARARLADAKEKVAELERANEKLAELKAQKN